MVYLSHIYQLAASARSVVAENKMLRMRLEASKKSPATLVSPYSHQVHWPQMQDVNVFHHKSFTA